jgi:hypothetical protein
MRQYYIDIEEDTYKFDTLCDLYDVSHLSVMHSLLLVWIIISLVALSESMSGVLQHTAHG